MQSTKRAWILFCHFPKVTLIIRPILSSWGQCLFYHFCSIAEVVIFHYKFKPNLAIKRIWSKNFYSPSHFWLHASTQREKCADFSFSFLINFVSKFSNQKQMTTHTKLDTYKSCFFMSKRICHRLAIQKDERNLVNMHLLWWLMRADGF